MSGQVLGGQTMNEQQVKTWRDAKGCSHSGAVAQAAGEFDVINCAACGFRHAIPVPTPEQLETIYSHEYYSVEKPLYIERYQEDKPWWDAVYAERYALLEEKLGPDRRRILDVGSGPGLFLSKGKERGWQVKGVEPSTKAAAYSREVLGLDVDNVFLDEHSAPTLGTFDAVNMGEVLEHLPDPAAILRIAHGLLRDGGLLCLIVPNDFNPFQGILRDHLGHKPWWVAPPHHLNYFDFPSLRALVERCGFAVAHEEATFPIDMFLMMGQNYIGNDTVGRQCHGLRKQFDLNLLQGGGGQLKRDLYSAFAKNGIGREIVLYAAKMRPREGKEPLHE